MSNPLVSRGPVGLIAAIFAGGVSVGLLLTALTQPNAKLAVFALFTGLPVYLAGLGGGALAGIVAVVTAAVGLYFTQPASFVVFFLIVFGIPAMTMIRYALKHKADAMQRTQWLPEGTLLMLLTLYPCFLFLLGAYGAMPHGGLLELTTTTLNEHATDFAAKFPDNDPEAYARAVRMTAAVMPAFGAYIWIMMTLVTMTGAQNMLRKQGWNLRDKFSFITLRLPNYLIYGVAVTGLIGALAPAPYDYIGRNLSMILGLPYFFVGLAIAHSWVNTIKHSLLILFALYAAMMAEPWIALLITALGVIDQWVDFRQRIITRKTTV